MGDSWKFWLSHHQFHKELRDDLLFESQKVKNEIILKALQKARPYWNRKWKPEETGRNTANHAWSASADAGKPLPCWASNRTSGQKKRQDLTGLLVTKYTGKIGDFNLFTEIFWGIRFHSFNKNEYLPKEAIGTQEHYSQIVGDAGWRLSIPL